MFKKALAKIPFTPASREQTKTNEGLAGASEALAANNQERAEEWLSAVALTQKKGAKWSVGIILTDDGLRPVQRTKYSVSRMVNFTDKQLDSLKQSLDVIAANPTVRTIDLLVEINQMAWNGVYSMDTDRVRDIEAYALDKIKQAIPILMQRDVEAGFQAVTDISSRGDNWREWHGSGFTTDTWDLFRSYKEDNLQRLIDKNHNLGMAELGDVCLYPKRKQKLRDLFESYIDDPALFSKNKFMTLVLNGTLTDWVEDKNAPAGEKPSFTKVERDLFSPATQKKIFEKLVAAYAPRLQEDARADETVNGMVELCKDITDSGPEVPRRMKALYKGYIDDPSGLPKEALAWFGLMMGQNRKHNEVLDKLADAYAPDAQDEAKAIATIENAVDIIPQIEWRLFDCRDSDMRANGGKIRGLLNKSLSDYFTRIAAAPDKATDTFIAIAADLNQERLSRDKEWRQEEGEGLSPATVGELMDLFNFLTNGVVDHDGWDKAVDVAARIRDTGSVPERIRDYAAEAVKLWQLPPRNG